jgi:hypothetical protein
MSRRRLSIVTCLFEDLIDTKRILREITLLRLFHSLNKGKSNNSFSFFI